MALSSALDIGALSNLLSSAQDNESQQPTSSVKAVTPADLFPAGHVPSAVPSSAAANPSASDGDIWDDGEVATKEEDSEVFKPDGRARPKYDILHKQKVSAEDVYLGASERDPSSAFCDELVVVVELPGEQGKDIDLDVTRQRFVLQAKKHKLAIYLPYPVKHKSGKAQWVSDKLQLRVALPCIKPDPLTGELPILDD